MGKLVDVHKFFCSECEHDSKSGCTWGGTCFVRDFPTDYDVDKVAEQLSDEKMWRDLLIYDLTFREREIVKKAIEIVKRGGVDANM